MNTLKTTMLQQAALQDNVRSAGLIKFSSGVLLTVIMSVLVHYLIRNVVFIPEGLPSLFFAIPFYSLPLFYAFAGFIELVSGEPITALPRRWKKYSITQRRFYVVIISFIGLIAISVLTLGYVPSYLRLL